MKITRKKGKFIIEIEDTTQRYNPYDETEKGTMDTLIGLITKSEHGNYKEMGLALRIDMAYKGKDDQVGDFLVKWPGTQETFKKICKTLKLDILEY